MASDSKSEHDTSQSKQHTHEHAAQIGPGLDQAAPLIGQPQYPSTLLNNPSLQASRNLPVRIAVMQQAQQMYGNRAVQRMIHASAKSSHIPTTPATAVGGLKPDVAEEQNNQFIGGRTWGEAIGDVGRPIGRGLGNVVGSVTGALTGITISSATNSGPTWNNHGDFDWRVGFSTTGTSGWLVQEVVNTYRAQDAAGADLGAPTPTRQYWEAWAVDASSAITPSVGANNDFWLRPGRGNNTQGHWSMTGAVYFTTTDPSTQGFAPGNVPDAGILASTTTAPSGLGIARLHRYAQGTWDSTGTTPTHTGSAA